MSKELKAFTLSLAKAEKDLPEFKAMLDGKDELSEEADILPFFKSHPHLAALSGAVKLHNIDRSSRELSLFGHFRCDWAVGDSTRNEYVLIEFEDARRTSVFDGGTKYHADWGRRLEHGFSQVVDWFWSLDAYRETPDFIDNFGEKPRFYAMLVIGRRKFVNPKRIQRARFDWRHYNVSTLGHGIHCYTFDDLYDFLRARLIGARGIADRGDLD